jgi:hypothetical protein
MGQTRRYMCRCSNVVVLVQFLEAWLQKQRVPNTRKQLKRVLNTEHETFRLVDELLIMVDTCPYQQVRILFYSYI